MKGSFGDLYLGTEDTYAQLVVDMAWLLEREFFRD